MWSQTFLLLILLSLVIAGRRGGGSHSYPTSHGYSGTGSGNRGHTYPHSTSMSGNTHVNQQSTTHLSGNTHVNQQSTSVYGNTRVNHNPTSMSGNTHVQQTYTQQNNYVHKTEVHHHYHYSPPQQITYGSTYHPVYHGPPPVYIYEYRDSGSRFDSLLTGLALYNLGRMSANRNYDTQRQYRSSSNEICKLGISKTNGEYEETRIDCKLMSSFIWEAESQPATNQQVVSSNTVTTTVVQSSSNSIGTRNNNGPADNSAVVTTVTVQNKTVVDALHVKGPSIQVTSGMNCFMIRISRDSSILKRKVECGLLQAYAQNSLHYRSDNNRLSPCSATLMCFTLLLLLINVKLH